MKFLAPFLIVLLPITLLAGENNPLFVIPAGVGVNIHFVGGHQRDLDMIADAGFKWVRMDFAWESIEKTKGVYDWSAYDELTANLEKHGLGAIYILDYSNPLYEEKAGDQVAAPHHSLSVDAFSKWAAAAANHYHGKRIMWEIWNEPNGGFWKPVANVSQYSALAVATAAAIRAADAPATIIAPACAGFDWRFLETFLQSSVLENLDAVSVHPYRDFKTGPETAAADYARLRGLIEKYAPTDEKKKMPILSGEWGYSTQHGGASLETQAAYAVRQQLSNLMNGVPLSIWYDWQNDGPDANYNEHNFGTVMNDLTPKPAYIAIKTMTKNLGGYVFKERMASNEKDYLLIFTNYHDQKLAAWTTGEPHQVKASFGVPKGLTGVDGMGKAFTPKIEDGKLVIDLEPLPKYVAAK